MKWIKYKGRGFFYQYHRFSLVVTLTNLSTDGNSPTTVVSSRYTSKRQYPRKWIIPFSYIPAVGEFRTADNIVMVSGMEKNAGLHLITPGVYEYVIISEETTFKKAEIALRLMLIKTLWFLPIRDSVKLLRLILLEYLTDLMMGTNNGSVR